MSFPILIADDNPHILLWVEDHLKQMQYIVDTASNAAQALRVIQSGRIPRLLISDIIMPGPIDGLELARIVKKRYPTMGILLMTGWSDCEHEFACLQKPFELSQVTDFIKDFVHA